MIIAVSTLENVKLTKTKFLAILVTCLTGPFSLIASPIIFLRVLLNKSFSGNKSFYALVILGACTQVYLLITKASERVVYGNNISLDAIAWIKSFIIIMFYGAYKYNYWTI